MVNKAESKRHFKNWRKDQKSQIEGVLGNYKYIMIGNLTELPAKAEREFRALLKKNGCYTKVGNSKVIKNALNAKGITNLDQYLKGPTMVILANDSPFKLFKEIKKNAASAFAKEGMIAPEDIVVKEGDTGIPPGPALTDFKLAKIDTQIRNGKIYVSKNTVVAKKGDPIDAKVSVLLTKLNIKPMKILLDLRTVLDKSDNVLYFKDLLDVNVELLVQNLKSAHSRAYYLAIGNNYITKQTIKPLLVKGYRNSKAVALGGNVLTHHTKRDILAKAHRIAHKLSTKVN